MIAHLAAGLGVERRLVEHEFAFVPAGSSSTSLLSRNSAITFA